MATDEKLPCSHANRDHLHANGGRVDWCLWCGAVRLVEKMRAGEWRLPNPEAPMLPREDEEKESSVAN